MSPASVPSSRGPGCSTFTAKTRVQISLGSPILTNGFKMNAKIIGMIVLEAVGFVLAIVSILGFIPLVGAFVGLVMIIAGALLPDVLSYLANDGRRDR